MIFKVEWNLNEKKIGSYNWHHTIIEELINVRESNLTSILDMNENNFILKDLIWMVYLVYVNTKKMYWSLQYNICIHIRALCKLKSSDQIMPIVNGRYSKPLVHYTIFTVTSLYRYFSTIVERLFSLLICYP